MNSGSGTFCQRIKLSLKRKNSEPRNTVFLSLQVTLTKENFLWQYRAE